jgi:hypothetical protein
VLTLIRYTGCSIYEKRRAKIRAAWQTILRPSKIHPRPAETKISNPYLHCLHVSVLLSLLMSIDCFRFLCFVSSIVPTYLPISCCMKNNHNPCSTPPLSARSHCYYVLAYVRIPPRAKRFQQSFHAIQPPPSPGQPNVEPRSLSPGGPARSRKIAPLRLQAPPSPGLRIEPRPSTRRWILRPAKGYWKAANCTPCGASHSTPSRWAVAFPGTANRQFHHRP